jgi:hypothetical protein
MKKIVMQEILADRVWTLAVIKTASSKLERFAGKQKLY